MARFMATLSWYGDLGMEGWNTSSALGEGGLRTLGEYYFLFLLGTMMSNCFFEFSSLVNALVLPSWYSLSCTLYADRDLSNLSAIRDYMK
jgi:hypothetical protein